ncbi:MAG TPA: PAS domain-containing protein [Dongiaceae bacterium]|nr:PAS domain-containing protein [Dongiaceae bacterium]
MQRRHNPRPANLAAEAIYASDPCGEAGGVEIVTIGNIGLELLGGLRLAMTQHRDRRWQQFFDYWLRLAEERGALPSRQAIDPLQMPRRLIANLFMTEVVYETGNQPRFRFRLLGQEITEQEHTKPGQYVHELGGSQGAAPLETQYLDCLNRRLWLRHTNLSWADRQKSFIRYEVLLLPLARDGHEIDAMIGLAIYQN